MMKIFAHRGCSDRYPENTAIAFEKALEAGCDGIECDVQLTRDGFPVIIHDETVDRTSNGKGFVKDLSLSELRSLDFSVLKPGSYGSQRILTLPELLDLIRKSGKIITLNLELKNSIVPYPGLEEIVLDLMEEQAGRMEVIYSSFNHESVRRLNSLKPGIMAAPLMDRSVPHLPDYIRSLGSSGVHPSLKILTPFLLYQLRRENFYINVYTVNTWAAAWWLQKNKVSGIFSDRCPQLKEALSHGKKSGPHQA